jgi:DNA-binding transcriptional MerR regulator
MKERYYIKDLEKILCVRRKTFFYWEKTGKVPKAKRTPMGNYRYWTEQDIKKLRKITGRIPPP